MRWLSGIWLPRCYDIAVCIFSASIKLELEKGTHLNWSMNKALILTHHKYNVQGCRYTYASAPSTLQLTSTCFRGKDTTGHWGATDIPAAKLLLQDQVMDFTFCSVQEGEAFHSLASFYLNSWLWGAWLSIVVFFSLGIVFFTIVPNLVKILSVLPLKYFLIPPTHLLMNI